MNVKALTILLLSLVPAIAAQTPLPPVSLSGFHLTQSASVAKLQSASPEESSQKTKAPSAVVGAVKRILDGLNQLQGLLVTLFTAVLVLYNRSLARETTQLRKRETEPKLEAYLLPYEGGSTLIAVAQKHGDLVVWFQTGAHEDYNNFIRQLRQIAVTCEMLPNYDDFLIRRFEQPDEVRTFEKGKFETVKIGGMTIGRASYEPGWKWSQHVGAASGAKFCEVEQVGLVVSGCASCQMKDGLYYEMKPGDLFYIGPGHDSWVVGNEPYVSLHFFGAEHYAEGNERSDSASF